MRIVDIDIETTGMTWDSRILSVALGAWDTEGQTPVWAEEKERYTGAMYYNSSLPNPNANARSYTRVLNLGYRDLFTGSTSIPTARQIMAETIRDADWLCLHNASFDLAYLMKSQLLTYEDVKDRIFDTLTMARCTGGHDSVAFLSLLEEYGLVEDRQQLKRMKERRGSLEKADPLQVMRYGHEEVSHGVQLFRVLYELAMAQYDEEFIRREGTFSSLIAKMRHTGKAIDVARFADALKSKKSAQAPLYEELGKHKIHSPDSASAIDGFLSRHDIRLPLTEKGNPKNDKQTLEEIPGVREWLAKKGSPEDGSVPAVIGTVLKARRIAKEIDTWLEPFLEQADGDGRVHPNYSAGGTVSYRLTCRNPNDQSVPEEMRMYAARKGKIYRSTDYSQAELRLGAAYGKEDSMAQAFFDGVDIHQASTDKMLAAGAQLGPDPRKIGKVSNFTGFYGGGAEAMSEALGIEESLARTLVKYWREAHPNVWANSKKAEAVWATRGYLLLHSGKRLWASEDDKSRRPYKAFNQLVQGGIAEMIKEAMLTIDEELAGEGLEIVGQAHDDLAYEIPEWTNGLVRRIEDIMTSAGPRDILDRTNPPIMMKVDTKESN